MVSCYQSTWYLEVKIMNEDMKRLEEIIAEIEESEGLSPEAKSSVLAEAVQIMKYVQNKMVNGRDDELISRISIRLEQYKLRHKITRNEEVAENFIRHIAFNPNNKSFRLNEIQGWSVIEQDEFDPDEIIIHSFHIEAEAKEKFEELYPNGADKSAMKYLIYETTIDVSPAAGVKSSEQTDLSSMSESDALDEIIKKGAKNFAEQITSINNALKDEEQTGVMNSSNPTSLKEAIARRMQLQQKLETIRAKHTFELLRDSDNGEKYLVKEKSWSDQNMRTAGEKYEYPNPSKDTVKVTKSVSIGYSLLLEFDRFLADDMEVTVGMALSLVHPKLAESMGADPKWRKSLSGTVDSDEVDFGRHLGSNLKDMIHEMAHKGFDSQLIFKREKGSDCIGLVRLSDVTGLMSDNSYVLRDESTVSDLKSLNLIRPPPPQIDASVDLSVAGNILKHGNDCVIIKFDPENWLGSDTELTAIKKILEPGCHILTSHDVIAYRLTN